MGKAAKQKKAAPERFNAVAAKPAKNGAVKEAPERPGKKRKVEEEEDEDMTVDDFLEHGLDDDSEGEASEGEGRDSEEGEDNSEAEDEEAPTGKKGKKGSAAAKHHEMLMKLKEKDPAFFETLAKEEPGLLEFGADEDEEESEGEGEGEGGEDGGHGGDGSEYGMDMDDVSGGEEEEEEEEKKPAKLVGKAVTKQMLAQWEKEAFEDHSLNALRSVLSAFKAAAHAADEEDPKKPKTHFKYRLEGSAVFNKFIVMCLRKMPLALNHHVPVPAPKDGKPAPLPSKSKNWRYMKGMVKSYVANLLHFVRQLSEPTMLAFSLQCLEPMAPYFACYPKLARLLVKTCLGFWSGLDEKVQVMSFLVVRRVALAAPSTFLDFCLKHVYMAYVRNCKFHSAQNHPRIVFMENCVVELCTLDPSLTYHHAFVYIRQLAIHLRTALTTKKKEAYSNVYNWQYIHCAMLWCRVVADIGGPELMPLGYPLVQLMLGVVGLVPTAQYFPLRFHVLRSLNHLARATNTFVPITPLIFEVFNSTHISHKPKASTGRPPMFQYILRVSKGALGTKAFQEGAVDLAVGLLLENVAMHSCAVAYPEYAFPLVVQLQRLQSKTKNYKIKNGTRELIKRLKENVSFVTAQRTTVTFGPKDTQEVAEWEENLRAKGDAPLQKYFKSWQQTEQARREAFQEAVDKDMKSKKGRRPAADEENSEDESDYESDGEGEGMDMDSGSDVEGEGEEEEGEEGEEEEEEEEEEVKEKGKGKKEKEEKKVEPASPGKKSKAKTRATPAGASEDEQDDVVEDLRLSDLDD